MHEGPWAWLHQVHGADVISADQPGGGVGTDGDALVSSRRGLALAVFTADCAPVALASPQGVIGVVHAGWRGLLAGVVSRAVEAVRARGGSEVLAALGPCIRGGCYEFGPAELDRVAAALGDDVRTTTAWGTPGLDLAAGVRAALRAADVELVVDVGACTACSRVWFSHRARTDAARQATLIWIPHSAQCP